MPDLGVEALEGVRELIVLQVLSHRLVEIIQGPRAHQSGFASGCRRPSCCLGIGRARAVAARWKAPMTPAPCACILGYKCSRAGALQKLAVPYHGVKPHV